MHQISYKFRIYPNLKQQSLLNQTFGSVRFYWNLLVDNFNNKISSKSEKEIRKEFDWLKLISAASLQQRRRDFDEFKKQFFNKKRKQIIGKAQYKKKGKSRNSYRLPNQKFVLDQIKSKIKLEKIGWINIVLDRSIPDNAKFINVTISKNKAMEYYVSIALEQEMELKSLTSKMVGIDLGLKDLFTTSDGLIVGNPQWFRKSQAKLRSAQKHLSRKQFLSKNWKKQRIKVAKIHNQIANKRDYYLHQFTNLLINNYDLIAIENLNIEGMKQKFGKSVSDISLSSFVKQLEYKSKWYGKTIIKIDRYEPSTQLCSNCGTKTGPKGLEKLNKRLWNCSECGTVHHRDHNAAINILKAGYKLLTSVELTDYRHEEDVRHDEMVMQLPFHLQSSLKCLSYDDNICH